MMPKLKLCITRMLLYQCCPSGTYGTQAVGEPPSTWQTLVMMVKTLNADVLCNKVNFSKYMYGLPTNHSVHYERTACLTS